MASTSTLTLVRQARPQGRRRRHKHGRSQGQPPRTNAPGSGIPRWLSQVTIGHNIAARSTDRIVGIKMDLPR